MSIRNSEGNPSIAGEARDVRCPHELILMQLVLNGALRILEDSETERSEALRRAECGRLQSALDAVQEALYWANNEVEETLLPAAR